jgi:fructose-1-phosphate kinase PfkB-like protein
MLGYKINSPKMLYDTLKNLIQKSVSIVLLSLGRKGAILFSKDNLFYVSVPKIKVESSVGCGDAFLAGFLYQFSLGNSQEESLKFAAASGTAKAMLKGTLMPNEREIYKVLAQIKTQKLNLEDPASFSFLSL